MFGTTRRMNGNALIVLNKQMSIRFGLIFFVLMSCRYTNTPAEHLYVNEVDKATISRDKEVLSKSLAEIANIPDHFIPTSKSLEYLEFHVDTIFLWSTE